MFSLQISSDVTNKVLNFTEEHCSRLVFWSRSVCTHSAYPVYAMLTQIPGYEPTAISEYFQKGHRVNSLILFMEKDLSRVIYPIFSIEHKIAAHRIYFYKQLFYILIRSHIEVSYN